MADRELTRWDPFGDLDTWRLRPLAGPFGLSRVLDEFFTDRPGRAAVLQPPLDVTEEPEHYVLTAELPGVSRDDVTVEVHEGVVTIRGEKKLERREGEGKSARLLERRYGSFSRSLALPADADEDRVEASFKDGVLELRIAKTAEAKPRTVAIKG